MANTNYIVIPSAPNNGAGRIVGWFDLTTTTFSISMRNASATLIDDDFAFLVIGQRAA
jgi:hypothetical protein